MTDKHIPDHAKAAAVLVFTSGVEDFDMAVKIYEALEEDEGPVQMTLDKFPGALRWSRVDELDDGDWWDEVQMLAHSITAAQQHFKELA